MRPKLKFLLAAAVLTFVTAQAEASTISISLFDAFDPSDVFITNQVDGSLAGGGVCIGNNLAGISNDTVNTPAEFNCGSLSWTHTLLLPPNNYNSATDTLSSASLVLTFYDDDESGSPGEPFDIQLNVLPFLTETVASGSTAVAPYLITYDVFNDIIDGLLNVYFTDDKNGNHDFYFAQSILTAEGTRFVDDGEIDDQALTETPEPTSMVLLGTGLIGFAFHRFRSRRA